MGESFGQQKELLHNHYGVLSMDDRRQMLCKLHKRNILMYRQLERLKHDLPRLEPERIQCELEENQTRAEVVETKISEKKKQFLRTLTQNKK